MTKPFKIVSQREETLPRRWYGSNYIAAVADNLRCPHCTAMVHPSDVQFDDVRTVSLICRGCHRDLFRVELCV